ncbi:MAG: hypothetical protein ACO1RX_00155 [Candidatus Sericytochromatia bacterium]
MSDAVLPVSPSLVPSFSERLAALQPLLQSLHASPWQGQIEEVGTGSWIQVLLQSAPGASATLLAARCSYSREAQQHFYPHQPGLRSLSRQRVENWAQSLCPLQNQGFGLAISGAVASVGQTGDCHAWLALALADGRRWSLHVRCCETERLAQQFSLGELGVEILVQLGRAEGPDWRQLSGVKSGRLSLDVWDRPQFSAWERCLEAARLILAHASPLLVLQAEQGSLRLRRPLDLLRGRALLVHKGAFNPVTRAHLAMITAAQAAGAVFQPVLEISVHNLDKGDVLAEDLAHRLMMLSHQPWPVLLSRTPTLLATQALLHAEAQAEQLDFLCGEDLYRRVFEARYYTDWPGGAEAALAQLLQISRLWVCARQEHPTFSPEAAALAEHWSQQIKHVPLDLPQASSQVRAARAQHGNTAWDMGLQPEVAAYIQTQDLYAAPLLA